MCMCVIHKKDFKIFPGNTCKGFRKFKEGQGGQGQGEANVLMFLASFHSEILTHLL